MVVVEHFVFRCSFRPIVNMSWWLRANIPKRYAIKHIAHRKDDILEMTFELNYENRKVINIYRLLFFKVNFLQCKRLSLYCEKVLNAIHCFAPNIVIVLLFRIRSKEGMLLIFLYMLFCTCEIHNMSTFSTRSQKCVLTCTILQPN